MEKQQDETTCIQGVSNPALAGMGKTLWSEKYQANTYMKTRVRLYRERNWGDECIACIKTWRQDKHETF